MLVDPTPEKRRLSGAALPVVASRLSIGVARGPWLALVCAVAMVLCARGAAAAPATAEAPATTSATASDVAKPASKAATPLAKTASAAASGQRQTEAYGERLDALDTEANALKDRLFRSKARLAVLRETVLAGAMAGARVLLAHRNLMGTGFQLSKVTYFLDGAPIFDRRDDSGALDQEDEIIVFDGNLAPGHHIVGIELIYKGRGVGSFSYLRSFTFQASSTYDIDVGQRGSLKIVSVGYERGNITTEMGDRPSVDWQKVILDAGGRPTKATKSATKKTGKGTKGPAKASGGAKTPPAKAGAPKG